MSDDPTRIQPEAPEPDDADAEVAAALAVEPLDDVTRRRLVRTALDATPRVSTPRRNRAIAALGVAAAVVIGVVIGTVVVTRPDEPQQNTAAPAAPKTAADGAGSASVAPKAAANPQAAANAPADASTLIDLGPLGTIASTEALRNAVQPARDAAVEAGRTVERATVPCIDRGADITGLGTVSASGTGTFSNGPGGDNVVVVLVGKTPDGRDRAVALDTQNCVRDAEASL